MGKPTLLAVALASLVIGCGDSGTTPTGGMGGDAGTAGSGGTATGGTGGTAAMVHGCTQATAMDMTGMANVNITDIVAWTVPHNVCIRVSNNTSVTFAGNFDFHPLAGGVSPNKDNASPITTLNANNGNTSASVALQTGTYPYYCEIHTLTMQGVIYVE